jgi:hypothetical protein
MNILVLKSKQCFFGGLLIGAVLVGLLFSAYTLDRVEALNNHIEKLEKQCGKWNVENNV